MPSKFIYGVHVANVAVPAILLAGLGTVGWLAWEQNERADVLQASVHDVVREQDAAQTALHDLRLVIDALSEEVASQGDAIAAGIAAPSVRGPQGLPGPPGPAGPAGARGAAGQAGTSGLVPGAYLLAPSVSGHSNWGCPDGSTFHEWVRLTTSSGWQSPYTLCEVTED